MAKTPSKLDPENVLQSWCDRDLSAAAKASELAPALEVDDLVEELQVLLAARRSFLLVGEPGVGKTAVLHELVRRAILEKEDETSVGGTRRPSSPTEDSEARRFVQISLQHRASTLNNPANQMGPEMHKLTQAILELGPSIVPVIRDFDYVYVYGLEPQILALLYRFPGSLMAEGQREVVDAMLETSGELEQHVVVVPLPEPSLDTVGRILAQWNASHDEAFTKAALEQALTLTHRFLVRTRLPRKVFDFLTPLLSLHRKKGPITEADVVERFSVSHRVPRQLVDPAMPLDLGKLEVEFEEKVLGQEEAIKTVVKTIGMIKAGLSDVRRPFGVFLFVGPTGVGKTHVAQLLAEYLFGSRERVLRFNMADYQLEYSALTLFGNPDGYGAQRRGTLTLRLMGHPFGVLLLDEFEKAHPTVHDRFLQLADEGGFLNGQSETIQCRSLILIATSNAGAELYRSQRFGFSETRRPSDLTKEINRELERHFRFEFLNRFDHVVHFHPLRRKHIRVIAERELELLRERSGIKQRKLSLDIDESLLDWLSVRGYDPDYGARFLKRLIEREVTSTLAEAIVRESAKPGARIELRIRGNRVTAQVHARKKSAAPRERSPRPAAGRLPMDRPEELMARVKSVLEAAEPLLSSLAAKRDQRSHLLARMNEREFWDKREENEDLLERFRELDVDARTESRLARPIERLKERFERVVNEPASAELQELSRELATAETSLTDWELRCIEEGPRSVWLLMESVDLFEPVDKWLGELIELERRWCRRLHLHSELVAYSLSADKLSRVALQVEGVGAHAILMMEEGIHRFSVNQGPDPKVRIRVLARDHETEGPPIPVTSIRRRKGLLGLALTCRGRVDVEERGFVSDWVGGDEDTLTELLARLSQLWRGSTDVAEVARVYARDGAGARDPRTGAQHSRLKDVLKGDLTPFLEAWRRRPAALSTGTLRS